MKLISITLPLAVLATCYTALVSANLPDRIGAYYTDTECSSSLGHVLHEFQKSPITFDVGQSAKSVRIDHKTFTIYKDKDCTKEPRSRSNGGCARYEGEIIGCVKF